MPEYKISTRLSLISENISTTDKVLDVGTDHGKLVIYLKKKYPSLQIIASDNKKKALDNALANSEKEHLKLDLRLGNGLDVIKAKEIDTIVIAGMGALTILGILANPAKLEGIQKMIIQSNNSLPLIRKKITKLGFYIANEQLVLEHRIYYTIITFKKGFQKYNAKELFLGPVLLESNSSIFKDMCQEELKKLLILLKLIPKRKIITRSKIKRKINFLK